MPAPYDSTKPLIQSPVVEHGISLKLAKKMAIKLPFTTHIPTLSTDFIKKDYPTGVVTPSPLINEQKFLCKRHNNWSLFYFLLGNTCWVITFLFYPITVFAIFVTSCKYNYSTPEELTTGEMLTIVTSIAVIAGIIHYLIKLACKTPDRLPGYGMKKSFEFNRQEGTITYFKGNKVLYSHPFTEFDCYLGARSTRQGFIKYNMHLVHRYNGYNRTVPLHSLFLHEVSEIDEFKRLWNTIQWYMDTSQPLPDISVLEGSRQHDPITAEYDKETGRKSDFWRNMTPKEYDDALKLIMHKQRASPPLGEPLPVTYAEHNASA